MLQPEPCPRSFVCLQDSGELKNFPTPLSGRRGTGDRDSGCLAQVVCFAGTLYQRLVIAEQNLRSELYPYQER